MQIYVSDCYEWRIANLNMLKLPRYSASVATAASMYHGKKVTTEDLNTTTRLVNLSAEHDRDCLLDFSRPRLIVSMGRFTADARDRHKASLPANVERSANLASRSPSHPSLRYIKPSQGLLASEMFLCNDKIVRLHLDSQVAHPSTADLFQPERPRTVSGRLWDGPSLPSPVEHGRLPLGLGLKPHQFPREYPYTLRRSCALRLEQSPHSRRLTFLQWALGLHRFDEIFRLDGTILWTSFEHLTDSLIAWIVDNGLDVVCRPCHGHSRSAVLSGQSVGFVAAQNHHARCVDHPDSVWR